MATLIVDADTLLLSPPPPDLTHRRGQQLLQMAFEFEDRYMGLIAQHFSINKSLPLSFTTHH